MADTTHLEELFKQIRDEKSLHANTAQRVGNALLEIIPFLDGTFATENATETWVNDNFVTKTYFESLFELYNAGSKIATNATLPVDRSQLNIKSMFGFWTEQYLSALGKSDNGTSGGGVILNEPLESINNTFSSNPTVNGYSLLWNNDTKRWYYGAAAVGVTSVAMSVPTGFSVSGSPITASGTLALTFASGYSLPTTAKQTQWDTAYGWGNHANAGYLTGITATTVNNALGFTLTGTAGKIYNLDTINSALDNYVKKTGDTMSGNLVIAKSTPELQLRNAAGTYQDSLFINTEDGGNRGLYESAPKSGWILRFDDSGNTVLGSLGNVGIGITSPSYKLHVNGYARATRLYLSDNIYMVVENDGVHIVGGGLYADTFVSALGKSDGGSSGGGVILNEPLESINNTFSSNPTVNGYSLLWNNDTKRWYYGAAAGGVTSVAMSVPTGFSVSGSPITGSGTLALNFASGYSLPTTAKQTQWDTAYGWGDHSQAGYLTTSLAAATYLPLSGGTMSNTNLVANMNADLLDGVHLAGFGGSAGVMRSWSYGTYTSANQYFGNGNVVTIDPQGTGCLSTNDTILSLGYTKTRNTQLLCRFDSDGLYYRRIYNSGYGSWRMLAFSDGNVATATALQNARTLWGQSFNGTANVNGIMTFSTLAMAISYTDTWSDGTNTHPWHGYDHRYPNTGVFSTTISDYFGLTLKTSSGNISMTATGNVGIGTYTPSYKLDVNGTMRIIGVESNDITVVRNSDGAITTNALYGLSAIRHALSFKWYNSEWQIGNLRSADTGSDGFAITESNNKLAFRVYNGSSYGYIAQAFGGIRVGDGMIVWDSVNNALKVIKPDGTAANFYATGAVSALGISPGTSSVDTMAFNYLTVNTKLYVKGSGYTHSFYGNSNGILVIDGSEGIKIVNDLIVDGCNIETGGGSIYTGGGRLYLDSSRCIYVSGGNLYYYNGSTRKQIAFTS